MNARKAKALRRIAQNTSEYIPESHRYVSSDSPKTGKELFGVWPVTIRLHPLSARGVRQNLKRIEAQETLNARPGARLIATRRRRRQERA